MNLKDVLAAKGRHRTVSAKSSIAEAIRTMHAEKVGAVMVPDAEDARSGSSPSATWCGCMPTATAISTSCRSRRG